MNFAVFCTVVVLVLTTAFLNKSHALPAPIKTEALQIETLDGVILKGRRFPNPGGIKINLVHGFSETWYIFYYLAPALQELGYDVYAFNLRGHGNGDDRSLHPDFSPYEQTPNQMYGFPRMVTYDMAAIRHFLGPGPVVAVGHSKGGNVARYYNSGIRVYGKNTIIVPPPESESFDLVFPLGTPLHFKYDLNTYKIWSRSPHFLSDFLASLATSNRDPREDGSVLPLDPFGIRSLCYEAAHRCIGGIFYKGLLETDNLHTSQRDLAQIFEHGFSRPTRDFSDNIRFWGDNGFVLPDGTRLRGQPYPNPERLIQIVGSKDALATRADALAEAKERAQKATVWEMDGFAHVDMVFSKSSAEWLASRLHRRIQKILGPIAPDCSRFLIQTK